MTDTAAKSKKKTAAKPKGAPKSLSLKKLDTKIESARDSTENALEELEQKIVSLSEAAADQAKSNDAILEFMKQQSSRAIDHPVALNRKMVEVNKSEQDLGEYAAAGDSQIILGQFDINSQQFQDKAKILAFMEEEVIVYIQPSMTDQEVSSFMVGVNGIEETFHFGQQKAIKRKFVEGLARAKPLSYGEEKIQVKTVNGMVDQIINPATPGMRYPFTVIHDPSPIGLSWLQVVLAQS